MSKKSVVAIDGKKFEVDTSDKACSKFGFKHGDRIKHPAVGKGTVVGVASATEGIDPEPDVLWCTFDGYDKEKVAYSSSLDIKHV